MTKRFAAGLLSASLVAGLFLAGGPYAGTAYACSCAGVSTVEAGSRASDAVFSGEMVRGGLEDPDPEDGTMLGGVEFRVIEAWKGVSDDSAVLYGQAMVYYGKLQEGDMVVGNSCAYTFEKGERYLVYATRHEDGLQTMACDRTRPLADAEEDLRILGPPSEQLTDTGGPPLPSVGGVSLAAALFGIFIARVAFDRARPRSERDR